MNNDQKKKKEKIDEAEEVEKVGKEFESKYKRALADYQNLEKRASEQKREWALFANKELLLRILPVLDTLELAQKHVQNEGLTVSIQQFLDVLRQEGVTKVPTVGKEFNPHIMEVVSTKEGEDGKVLEEVRAGYMLHDKVLRPAQVVVGS